MSDDERIQANNARLDGCSAPYHDFRAPPRTEGVRAAYCATCGGGVSRAAAEFYRRGVRAGFALAAQATSQEAERFKRHTNNALNDPNAEAARALLEAGRA